MWKFLHLGLSLRQAYFQKASRQCKIVDFSDNAEYLKIKSVDV